MTTADVRAGLDVVYEAECLELMATEEVGRLAVSVGGQPLVFPVNYALDGREVVFRSNAGTKLEAGLGRSVCFEVDHFDRAARTGWSVIVVGRLEEVTPADSVSLQERIHSLPVEPWAGQRERWLRVVPRAITGRRI